MVVNLVSFIGDVVSDALAENSRRVGQGRAQEQENLARAIEAAMERQEVRFRAAGFLARVGAMGPNELGAHLARRRPPTVMVALPSGGPVLMPIAWERLGPSERSVACS